MKTKLQWMVLYLTCLIVGLTACKKEGAIVPQAIPADSTQNLTATKGYNSLRVVSDSPRTEQQNNGMEYTADNILR